MFSEGNCLNFTVIIMFFLPVDVINPLLSYIGRRRLIIIMLTSLTAQRRYGKTIHNFSLDKDPRASVYVHCTSVL